MLLPVVVSPPSPSTSNGLLLYNYYYYYYYYYYYCYCNSIITTTVTGNFSAHKHSLRHYYVAIGSMAISLYNKLFTSIVIKLPCVVYVKKAEKMQFIIFSVII